MHTEPHLSRVTGYIPLPCCASFSPCRVASQLLLWCWLPTSAAPPFTRSAQAISLVPYSVCLWPTLHEALTASSRNIHVTFQVALWQPCPESLGFNRWMPIGWTGSAAGGAIIWGPHKSHQKGCEGIWPSMPACVEPFPKLMGVLFFKGFAWYFYIFPMDGGRVAVSVRAR